MKFLLFSVILVFGCCVIPISATVRCRDILFGEWMCAYECCYSFTGCCLSFGAVYWYVWLIISAVSLLALIVCLVVSSCIGYRRYYRTYTYIEQPPPTATILTTTTFTTSGQPGYGTATPPPPPYSDISEKKQAPPTEVETEKKD